MKNYSLKKKIFAGLLILGALSAFPLYKAFAPKASHKLPLIDGEISINDAQQALATITSEGLNVTDAMRQELNAEHDRLLAELQQAFPLPDNQWEAMYKRLDAIIDSDDLINNQTTIKKSAKPLIAMAQEVLATTGINPERVTIELVEKPMSACDACAGQCFKDGKVAHFLQLNSVRLEEKELPVQQALLKHECMHLLNYDGLRQVFIESLLKKNGIENQPIAHIQHFVPMPSILNFAQIYLQAHMMAALLMDYCKALKIIWSNILIPL